MSGNDYQGAADPGSMANDLNSMTFHIQQEIAQLHGPTIVQVVKAPYDRDGKAITPGSPVVIGFVDVLPLVNQVDGKGNAIKHTTVYRLSYHRYQGGNGAFISDPVVGDQGKMIPADRDTSIVKQTNAQGNPGSSRSWDKADGTYFGQTQGKDAPKQWFAWGEDGWTLQDKHGNSIISSKNGIVIKDAVNGNTITLASSGIQLKTGAIIEATKGGAEKFVLVNGSPSISNVLKADS